MKYFHMKYNHYSERKFTHYNPNGRTCTWTTWHLKGKMIESVVPGGFNTPLQLFSKSFYHVRTFYPDV